MINEHLLVKIIIRLAYLKHDKRVSCHCEERDYHTIVISLDDIKKEFIKLDISFNDYEFLFVDIYNKSCITCFPSYEILILKYLKEAIKYEIFSRHRRKAKKVYISDYNGFYVVFEI